MYCWYFGGKTQKGYGKRYVYVFAESNQNKHMTPTLYDSTSFRYVSGIVSTNDAKNKNKFKVLQDSIWSQWISNRLSNFLADSFRAIWYWFSCKSIFVAISQYSIIFLICRVRQRRNRGDQCGLLRRVNTHSAPRGGGHSLIWHIRVCAIYASIDV